MALRHAGRITTPSIATGRTRALLFGVLRFLLSDVLLQEPQQGRIERHLACQEQEPVWFALQRQPLDRLAEYLEFSDHVLALGRAHAEVIFAVRDEQWNPDLCRMFKRGDLVQPLSRLRGIADARAVQFAR